MAPGKTSLRSSCIGGINHNPEHIQPAQVADARNVWAPNGVLEQRPGCVGIGPFNDIYDWSIFQADVSVVRASEDVSTGTFVFKAFGGGALDLSGFSARTTGVAGDRWYVGISALLDASDQPISGIQINIGGGGNTNPLRGELEYWNGTCWKRLLAGEIADGVYTGQPNHIGTASTDSFCAFVPPVDWAASLLGTYTRYWLRFTLVAHDPTGGAFGISAGTTITNVKVIRRIVWDTLNPHLIGPVRLSWPTTKRYVTFLSTHAAIANKGLIVSYHTALSERQSYAVRASVGATNAMFVDRRGPSSVAVLPQFNEAYVVFGDRVFAITPEFSSGWFVGSAFATVETRDFAIGPGAPWDKTTIAQLETFPQALFITFFQNRLWTIDTEGNLRWSAAAPYHRVWPSLAFSPLAEDDQSPPRAMAPLGESIVIYKNDSVWVASFSDLDAFDIPHYIPRKVVSGTGCVASGSLQSIQGKHVFLGESGVVGFDGQGVHLLTTDRDTGVDRLRNLWRRIDPGQRQWAVATHWKSKHCYLLAVPTDGAGYNNTIVCWDYTNDTWWIWDGLDVQCWINDEDSQDNETIYFANKWGDVYRFGIVDHDHGAAIDSWLLTKRFGFGDTIRKVFRDVTIDAQNTAQEVYVTACPNGIGAQHGKTATYHIDDAWEKPLGSIALTAPGTHIVMDAQRIREHHWRIECDWVQFKIAGAGIGKPLKFNGIGCEYEKLPERHRRG